MDVEQIISFLNKEKFQKFMTEEQKKFLNDCKKFLMKSRKLNKKKFVSYAESVAFEKERAVLNERYKNLVKSNLN